MDRGCKFMAEMQRMLHDDYGIRGKLTTTWNPQANSIVEHVHRTVQQLITSRNVTSKNDLQNGTWAASLLR